LKVVDPYGKKLIEDFFLLYVTKFVDLWNGRGSSSILLSLQRKGGKDDRAEAHHQPIEPQ
jgi:hypothetical protein